MMIEEYDINKYTVTTTTEALYWISKIWFENSHRTKDEKEEITKKVLKTLESNIMDNVL